jgi:rubredoxin
MRTAKQLQNPVQFVYREQESPEDRAAQAQAWRLLAAACCPSCGASKRPAPEHQAWIKGG